MHYPGFLLYSMMLLGGATYAEYRGYSLTPVTRVSNIPRTVRDNPGAYRSVYGNYTRYTGGK
jgi:hypothetical protein